jgi:hypothetical protein
MDRRFVTTLYAGRYYAGESWIVQRSQTVPLPPKEVSQTDNLKHNLERLLDSDQIACTELEAFNLGNTIIPRGQYEAKLLDLAKREIIPGSRAVQVIRDLETYTVATYLDVLRAVSRRLSVGCTPTQMKTLCRLYESCLTYLPIN